MISHKYKCIYIHIPKCAGTSIERAIGHYENYEGRGWQDQRSITNIERTIAATPASLRMDRIKKVLPIGRFRGRSRRNPNNELVVTKKQYQEYYKFAIIRNPWERAFSFYQGIIRDPIHWRRYNITPECSFAEFLRDYAGKGLLRRQTYWLKSIDGSINLDFIGRFETLQQDFGKICNDLNIAEIYLPHILKGSNTNHLTHYDEEAIEIIFDSYREEIELFGFTLHSGRE